MTVDSGLLFWATLYVHYTTTCMLLLSRRRHAQSDLFDAADRAVLQNW